MIFVGDDYAEDHVRHEASEIEWRWETLDGASLCQEACPLGCRVAGGRSGK